MILVSNTLTNIFSLLVCLFFVFTQPLRVEMQAECNGSQLNLFGDYAIDIKDTINRTF